MADSPFIDILWGADMVLNIFSIQQHARFFSFLKIKNYFIRKNIYYPLKNKKGQAAVEMVLILSIFLFIAMFISTRLEEAEVGKKIINRPWNVISGMIESGTWQANQGNDVHPLHPIKRNRRLSVEGEDVR